MSVINGNMLDRDINEISIILGLRKLNSYEKEGFIKDDKKEKFGKDFGNLLNMNEFQTMDKNGFEVMSGREMEKLKMGINGLLKKYGLGMISRSKLRILREEVKEVMWGYFKENRLNLSVDIGDFREEIIIELMKGGDVKKVFELYGGVGILKTG